MEVKYDEQTKQVAIYKPSFAYPKAVAHISVETQRGTFTTFRPDYLAVDIPASEAIERIVRI